MTADVETVVVGAGVVGLAIAHALAASGHEVLVLERNTGIGQETSARSSEVIHAGLYNRPGTLKATLCVEGNKQLYQFATDNGVSVKRTGKLIVATSDGEVKKLHDIAANARMNGVEDLEKLTEAEALSLEPHIQCVAALLSPSTGIVDSHGLMTSLAGHFQSNGGSVVLSTTVKSITKANGVFEISIDDGDVEAVVTSRNLILSAGHGMTELGRALLATTSYEAPRCFFAKGHYYTLNTNAPFRHLIYPVPVDGGLGIHLTLDLQGRARFGPDVLWVNSLDFSFDDPDGARCIGFENAIRRYWPGLPDEALSPAFTGIRPKISEPGTPARDFEIAGPADHGISGFVTLYGIESPGLTSALAIAGHVLNLFES